MPMRFVSRALRSGVWLVLLATLSGCAQLQNELVTALENAVRNTIDSTVSDVFDQFRNDNVP